ncbi:hypothetical protein [Verrucomicrobium sp. 3C]|uniref:hypothetical protein n=1 Tax=Verrucomicrobium sp. 3C TaxID=1134055 RepID=UPI0012DDCC2E|nr:hypothetical protein [Verrucomicrobium sp. 3C]
MAPGVLRGRALPILLVLGSLAALLPAGSEALPVQVVSVKTYYTLSLAGPAAPGQGSQPYVRYQAECRYLNWGSSRWVQIYDPELASLPHVEYRAWVDRTSLPAQKFGNGYVMQLFLRDQGSATVQVSSLQRVLPVDPARKIDEFEDLIHWWGWRPPIEDFWIVVDLGGNYAAYRKQTPAFGFGGSPLAPSLSFRQFLSNRIVQISPGGYQSGGNKIWWHARNIWKPEVDSTLHVQWQAWYR